MGLILEVLLFVGCLGMKLCTCFQRNSAKIPFHTRFHSVRSFSLTGVLYYWLIYFLGLKPKVSYHSNGINSLFLCASYRSLYLLSSLSFVRFCDVLFIVTANIIPTSSSNTSSMHLQCYCTHHFQNTYIFSSKLARRIISGFNLTHLILILLNNQQQS